MTREYPQPCVVQHISSLTRTGAGVDERLLEPPCASVVTPAGESHNDGLL